MQNRTEKRHAEHLGEDREDNLALQQRSDVAESYSCYLSQKNPSFSSEEIMIFKEESLKNLHFRLQNLLLEFTKHAP